MKDKKSFLLAQVRDDPENTHITIRTEKIENALWYLFINGYLDYKISNNKLEYWYVDPKTVRETELRTSYQWYMYYKTHIKDVNIIDPDGWDRKNYDYSFNREKISYDEFVNRLNRSTQTFGYPK